MKFISKRNKKVHEIANDAKYQMDKQFQNFLFFGILIIFQIKKKIWIPKISNLDNSQKF